MPRREDCKNCGHPYTFHKITKKVDGKDKVIPCPCTAEGCTCQAYEAPKNTARAKKENRKPRKPRKSQKDKKSQGGSQVAPEHKDMRTGQITIPIHARLLRVKVTATVEIYGKIHDIEVTEDYTK